MLDVKETDDGTQCWDCEEPNDGGNNVCTSCGHNLCFTCQVDDQHNCEGGLIQPLEVEHDYRNDV